MTDSLIIRTCRRCADPFVAKAMQQFNCEPCNSTDEIKRTIVDPLSSEGFQELVGYEVPGAPLKEQAK